MRRLNLIFVVLALALTLYSVATATDWQVVYQTDFSADPGWATNNSSHYYWDSSDQTYYIYHININYGGEYAYYDTGYDGGSFRLEWDVNMLLSSYATGIAFGLFDTGLYCHHIGNHAWVSFVRGDRGQEINLGWLDSGGAEGHMWSMWHYSLNTWYHVVLEYDSTAAALTATVSLSDTGEQLCSLAASDVGPFATDMDRVGTSNLRDGPYQVPGADSTGKIDNVVFATPQPPCGAWTTEPLVNTQANERQPVWSPDGKQIAYFSDESGSWQVYVVNSDGSGKWRVSEGSKPATWPTWSPDSQCLLYTQGDGHPIDLFKVRLNEHRDAVQDRWNLTQEAVTPLTLGWEAPQFSPDGEMIAAVWGYNGWPRLRTIMDRDGPAHSSDWTPIGKSYAMSVFPTWRPDSSLLAYCFFDNWQHYNLGDIWTIKPDGIEDTKVLDRSITQQHVMLTAWSPDGSLLAFSDAAPYETGSLSIVAADGSGFLQLDNVPSAITHQLYSWQADIWSPDGQSILYHRKEGDFWNIYLVDKDGTSRRSVVSSPADDMLGRFSGSGKIVFQTNRNGNWDIYVGVLTLCVPIDIKPGSCPNPLNVDSKGALPVAILGSEDFEANTVDIASVRLEGVGAVRSSSEDVATPVADGNECDCNVSGPDGFVDLVLKFETEEVVEAIGDVNEGDVLPLTLEAVLSDGGTMIEGTDCVVIRGRHRSLGGADINKDGVVDQRDFAVFATRWLQRALPDE